MAHDYPIDEPRGELADAADASPTPTRTPRHDGWTADKQVGFLKVLAATQNVRTAARSVGMGRQSAYKLRTRLDDAPFGAAWRLATQQGHSALLEAALARAINGVETPHYWQGELIGTSRRYDERLTALLLSSGLLERARPANDSPEAAFAQNGLARLLERIAQGPSEWRDPAEERCFAWNDDPHEDAYEDTYEDADEDEDDFEPGEPSDPEPRDPAAPAPESPALSAPAPAANHGPEPKAKPEAEQNPIAAPGSGARVRIL